MSHAGVKMPGLPAVSIYILWSAIFHDAMHGNKHGFEKTYLRCSCRDENSIEDSLPGMQSR